MKILLFWGTGSCAKIAHLQSSDVQSKLEVGRCAVQPMVAASAQPAHMRSHFGNERLTYVNLRTWMVGMPNVTSDRSLPFMVLKKFPIWRFAPRVQETLIARFGRF